MASGYNTTTELDSSIRAQYVEDYLQAAEPAWLYSQLADDAVFDKPQSELFRGSSVVLPFLNDLEPVTGTISQVYDVTPVQLSDGTVSVTPTSRINAITDSELLLMQTYTPYASARFKKLGLNMVESVDLVAQNAALQGGNVYRPAARALLNSGANEISITAFDDVMGDFMDSHAPGWETPNGPQHIVIMPPKMWSDLRTSAVILAIGEYQNQKILLNNELGSVGNFRIVVSPWAKTFLGAGADNATAIATTVATTAIAPGDLTFTVASGTSIAVGMLLNVGTEETGNTHYPTNEQIKVSSISGTTVGAIGQGPNGGFRFAHAVGVAVNNNDSVGTAVFGGPQSLALVYASEMGNGRYGTIVGPKKQGYADTFVSLAWKWYGAMARYAENRLIRGEFSLGRDS